MSEILCHSNGNQCVLLKIEPPFQTLQLITPPKKCYGVEENHTKMVGKPTSHVPKYTKYPPFSLVKMTEVVASQSTKSHLCDCVPIFQPFLRVRAKRLLSVWCQDSVLKQLKYVFHLHSCLEYYAIAMVISAYC